MSLASRHVFRNTTGVAFAIGVLLVCSATPTTPGTPETEWLKQNAHAFDTCEPQAGNRDLAFLRGIVGDAHIVALGEATHGTHEFFQMKRRIVEYLATEMGFQLFGIEANMPEAYRVNDYVLTGRGDPKALLQGIYFWTWNTQEVLGLIEWMRQFNQSGKGRIQFVGFDMQFPDTAAAIVERFVARAEPAYRDSVVLAYARVRAAKRAPSGFASATGTFPAAVAAGHRVHYSGWIRTEDVSNGFAGLWWRADAGEKHAVAFDNMQARQIKGTTPWTRYDLTLDLPANTTNINFGMLMAGAGTAWFDSLAVEIDGVPYAGNENLDLALERVPGPAGFWSPGLADWVAKEGYSVVMDSTIAVAGKRSVRIAGGASATPASTTAAWADARAGARRVLEHLEAQRERLVASYAAAAVDWAIQNARVVFQTADMNAGGQSRDVAMADNVSWILDHTPRGAKIVLWAHNGHVSRNPGSMGSYLAKKYGREMVVFGFAFHEGRYNAVAKEGGLKASDATPSAPGSLEWACHATGLPRFIVDLRRAASDPLASAWLAQDLPMRSIGAMAMEGGFRPIRVSEAYDALIYFDQTRPSELLR